jgi:hypothetical protein
MASKTVVGLWSTEGSNPSPASSRETETPEEARDVLLDLAFVPEDAIGPLIIMEARHLDRETVEGHFPRG